MVSIYFGVFSVVIVITICTVAICLIIRFITERIKMKRRLRIQRDAMVRDLLNRVMMDQAELSRKAFEARRNLIRASFEIGNIDNRRARVHTKRGGGGTK